MSNTNIKISSTSRKPKEGIIERFADETITLIVDCSEVAESMAGAIVEIYESTDNYTANAAASHGSPGASVSGTTLTLGRINSLAAGITYRAVIQFSDENLNVNRFPITIHCKAKR